MPQLDPSTFSSQLFWLAISFAVLWLGLRFSLPELEAVLRKRRRHVLGCVKKAKDLSQQAEKLLEAQESQTRKIEERCRLQVEHETAMAHEEESAFAAKLHQKLAEEEASRLATITSKQAENKRSLEKNVAPLVDELTQKLSRAYDLNGKGHSV